MEDFFVAYLAISFVLLLVFIAIIKWIISSSVKSAMYEVLYDQTFHNNLSRTMTISTLNALCNENVQNTVAMGVLKALEQYNNGKTNERPTE